MKSTLQHVGVDGCRAGWFAVTRIADKLMWRLFPAIDQLLSEFSAAQRIFIDVPIGLPCADAPIRQCDRLARQVLGQRRSSVFPVPCRKALEADGIDEARRINIQELGRSIGAQTWGISPKIKEVDRLLLSMRGQDHGIREVHPEVCFWALDDRNPMKHSKASNEGRNERIRILEQYEIGISTLLANALSSTFRKDLKPDDILDAAVALVTAEARHGELASLTGEPSHDLEGLPIEMLYLKI